MVELQDRIKASTDRIPHPTLDKEAFAVLALNDATARSRKGRFYYLPESSKPLKIPMHQHEPVVMKSIVPRLLYVDYEWTKSEGEHYVKMNDGDRYNHVQCNTREQLRHFEVIPINLVVQTSGMTSLSWPVDSLASVVIYGPGPWYKLSWMSHWTQKATTTNGGSTYQVAMYNKTLGKNKALYMQSVNFVGKLCGAEHLPLYLRGMLRLPVSEGGESIIVAEESRSRWMFQQNAMKKIRDCTWTAGVDVLKALASEATGCAGGEGFSSVGDNKVKAEDT